MIRKLVLGMTILALAALPLPAWAARDGGHDGRHEARGGHERFHGHERFGRPSGSGSIRSRTMPTRRRPAPGNPGTRSISPMWMRGAATPTCSSGCRGNGSALRDV